VLEYGGLVEGKDGMTDKPILVLDFDGGLHSYTSGWKGAGLIPDLPVKGAQKFCEDALEHFKLWIVSSRCNQEGGTEAIRQWLIKYNFPPGIHVSNSGTKPPAFLTIDDRSIQFYGRFPAIKRLLTFESWVDVRKSHSTHVKKWD